MTPSDRDEHFDKLRKVAEAHIEAARGLLEQCVNVWHELHISAYELCDYRCSGEVLLTVDDNVIAIYTDDEYVRLTRDGQKDWDGEVIDARLPDPDEFLRLYSKAIVEVAVDVNG